TPRIKYQNNTGRLINLYLISFFDNGATPRLWTTSEINTAAKDRDTIISTSPVFFELRVSIKKMDIVPFNPDQEISVASRQLISLRHFGNSRVAPMMRIYRMTMERIKMIMANPHPSNSNASADWMPINRNSNDRMLSSAMPQKPSRYSLNFSSLSVLAYSKESIIPANTVARTPDTPRYSAILNVP